METFQYDTRLPFELETHQEVTAFCELVRKILTEYKSITTSVKGDIRMVNDHGEERYVPFKTFSDMKLRMRYPEATDCNIIMNADLTNHVTSKTRIVVDWMRDGNGNIVSTKHILCYSNHSNLLLKLVEEIEKRWLTAHPHPATTPAAPPTPTTAPQAAVPEPEPTTPKLHLNKRKGTKTDFIRIVNVLWELDFFVTEHQNRLTKAEVFRALGRIIGDDLSRHEQILSRSMSDNTSLEKHLHIFDTMKQKMRTIFNRK